MKQAAQNDELGVARERAASALRDGREDEWLGERAGHAGPLQNDPFLTLQQGLALARLDRMSEAAATFRAALALPAITAEQAEFARRQLGWLDEEWAIVARGRAALWRARLGIGAGVLVLALAAGTAWILARRAALAGARDAAAGERRGRV